jgi:hypothetical protein
MAFIFHSKNPIYKSAIENSSCKGSTEGLMYPPLHSKIQLLEKQTMETPSLNWDLILV